MKAAKVIGILDCDELAPELVEDYHSYYEMFKQLLEPVAEHWEFTRYQVLDGQLPESALECDGYLLTGSKSGVYDEEDWLPLLVDFIQQVYDRALPLVGICFGHQMLAHTLGGKAERSDLGWGVGLLSHTLREIQPEQKTLDWFTQPPGTLKLLFSHQDQVVALPPNAVPLYGSHFCPHGAFCIPGKVLAFQGHPEFTVDYSQRLMALRQTRYRPGQYEQALDAFSQSDDSELVANWIVNFLEGEGAK